MKKVLIPCACLALVGLTACVTGLTRFTLVPEGELPIPAFTPACPDTLSDFRALTDRRIAEIRNTPNMAIPEGAECLYLDAEKGDDAAAGTSPDTAWKTTARLDKAAPKPGSYVLFARGGTYRGGFNARAGVTYTAYGCGPKPKIYSSPVNGADPAMWTKTDAPNVWSFQLADKDVGTVVFNEGEKHAIKILPVYRKDGTFTMQYGGKSFNNGYKDLKDDLYFWHDYSAKTRFQPHAKGTGKLYLYSKENPGLRFKSIEFNVRKHGIAVGGNNNVHVDNLCIKYVGSHGVGAGTVKGLKVTNCEIGWIGGSIQGEGLFGRPAATRFGNGIEIYGGCDDYVVDNCYIYQVYDAGLTQQVSVRNSKTLRNQKGMRYTHNVFEDCNYSIEYFLSGASPENKSHMEDFVIADNLMWNAATGFCRQRPDLGQGAHIKSWRNNSNQAKGYVVRNNLFAYSKEMLLEISSGILNEDGSDSMPRLEGNVFVGTAGQRFGVVNQGRPDEQKYTAAVESYLGAKANRNIFYTAE